MYGSFNVYGKDLTSKEKQTAYAKKHYEANKELCKKRAVLHKTKTRKFVKEWIRSYLLRHPCIDCGFTDIRALDFDHVRGIKFKDISTLTRNASSLTKIKEEIAKCDVRCSNCHRIQTDIRRQNKLR